MLPIILSHHLSIGQMRGTWMWAFTIGAVQKQDIYLIECGLGTY
jgi:hypothetical protein